MLLRLLVSVIFLPFFILGQSTEILFTINGHDYPLDFSLKQEIVQMYLEQKDLLA